MKIICIGWNYPDHNKEMAGIDRPQIPVVFMKPDSAVIAGGKPFFIPDFSSRIEYETELVVRIDRLGKNIEERFAHRYYSELTLGIDFTARDLQLRQIQNGAPWEIAKAFDGSAALGEFVSKETFNAVDTLNFEMKLNGATVQQANTKDMIFSVDKIVSFVSQYFTLKIGDLLFTGTPSGVGPVSIGDRIEGWVEHTKLLDFYVR